MVASNAQVSPLSVELATGHAPGQLHARRAAAAAGPVTTAIVAAGLVTTTAVVAVARALTAAALVVHGRPRERVDVAATTYRAAVLLYPAGRRRPVGLRGAARIGTERHHEREAGY